MRQLLRAVPWGAVLLYLGAALVVTYPLVFHLGDSVVGDLESDVWKHLWGFWWVKQCLVDQHVLPLYTALLNYPAGGSLFFIDPLGGLLSVPLQIFVAPHVAFNLLVLFNITLAGSGAFLLARYLTRSTPAAYVAGVIYGCSPYMLANVTSGISESYNIGWIPLFMLFFLRTLREAETSNAVWAGIFLATATVGCWYYGVFCAVFAALFFLCWSLEMWRAASRKAVDSGAAAQQVSGGNPRLYQLIIASLVLAYLYCSSWMRVYEPADAAFWDWLCGAAASLLALMLLVRMRRRAAKSEAEPPTGSGGAVFLLAYVLLMSAWMLLQMLPRALPLARLGDNLALLAMIVANGTALMISGRVLVNRLEGRAAEIGTLALRWTKLAIALAVTVDTVIAALSVRPAPAALESVQEQAGLAIQALVAVWLLYRARGDFVLLRGLADIGRRGFSRALAWRGRLGLIGRIAFIALAGVYLFAPPLSPANNLALWLGLTASLLLLWDLRGAAVETVSLLSRRISEPAQDAPFVIFYRTAFKRLLLMALVTGVLVMPVAYSFKRTLNNEVSIVFRVRDRSNVDYHLSDAFQNISRLVDYVVPGKAAARSTYTVDRLTRVSYAGWIVLLLALYAALRVRRRMARWWVAAAVAAVILSLGPFLYVTQNIYLNFRFPPYMWLYEYFPFFSQISIPYRFNAVGTLALAMLAAYALARLLRFATPQVKTLTAVSVSLGIMFEIMLVSPAPFPLPLSSVEAPATYQRLAAEPGKCGVVDLPLRRYHGELLPGEYFFYQTIHQKPIPNRVEGEIPIYVDQNPFLRHLFVLEHEGTVGREDRKSIVAGLAAMREFRFRYVIVHDNLMRPGARERVHGLLRHFLGAPTVGDANIYLYRIPDAPPQVGLTAGAKEAAP